MGHNATGIPAKLRLSFDAAPSAETRGALGYEIHAFHAQTVPYDAQRFALLLHDAANRLVAGLSGVLSWQWLFVEALWVGDTWRGRGIGRALLTQAEAYAVAAGCHSAWLDTFQARGFYLAIGYQQFGALNDYPPGQIRYFLRKRLVAAMEAPAALDPARRLRLREVISVQPGHPFSVAGTAASASTQCSADRLQPWI